ncbi:MAG: Ig-like domain-containing protein, partial [Bacteroidales bacterium]|nr:Ig-like domain-containing protein [Bacteroidales bacterium]
VHYTAKTHVVVTAKPLPYFVQQSMDLKVGESDQVVVMSQDGGPAQASLFTFETSDATVATVGRDGVVTAIAVGNAEVSVLFEGSLVGKVGVAVDVAPQMPTPGYNTNVLTMCFDKSATTNGGTSLERMVYPTSDFGKLKWYDASGNELSAAPVVSAAQAGKAVYYVSQIGMGELANYRESEKVPYTVEIVYVAEPKLNVADQSTCQGATAVPFVATTNTENVVEWTDVTGAVVAQGTEFLPQVPTSGYYTYKVTAKNTMGCVSNPLTVTYTVGNAVKPEIFVATQAESFVVGEPVTLGTSNQMSDEYSVVWSLGDNEYVHGTEFTTKFEEVGTYTVTCKVVETNTGCADSASKVITVEEKVIPLQTIVVEPETVTLYEGEQGYVSLAFEPSYASNMAYTIEVEDTEVADVVGLTVWAVAEGTTKATITSVENPDVKAEFNIVVNKLIKAKEISMPNIITLALNEETKVAASVIPAEASYNKVAFKEKTDNVISIDAEGNIKALGEGTSTIVAYSNGGLQATAVVYVTAAQTAITDIAVPDEIELKLRDSVVVSYKVTPVTLAAKLLEWAIEDGDIATYSNGVVKAVSAGETNLTVSIGNISKTIKITVTTSSAPVIGTAPKLAFEQGKNITVDFADFVSDDETELANLTFEAASEDLNVSIDGTVATVTAKSDSYVGTTNFTLSVTDGDGLTTSADVPVEVTEIANQAPVVLIEDVQIKYNACTYLKLSDIFSDDRTPNNKLKYSFSANVVSVKVCMKTQLSMISKDPELEYDTLYVTVKDAEGLETTAKILMYVNSLPNKAPKISEIPVQTETDDAAFGTIELANYVKDDYTAASSIKWTTSGSDNLSISIDGGVASVEVLNAFWNGAEAITFYAADEEGLKDSTSVYYSRKVTINEETVSSGSDDELTPVVWEGAPVVNIMAMKFIGVPGEQFIIMASMSGYDCTWAWEIEGANGIDQTSLMQMVSFDNPGTYTVKLTVQSADGQHSIEVVKENLLTVVGINERTPAICKGDAVTLTATEGLDSYYWTTGDVKNTTTARPEATMLYKLTMKKGMFTLVDTVTVKVSVPVALMEDSVMCVGTTFDLEAIGDYVSYAWNTGDVEKAITIPSEVASYTVTAVDDMQCVSVDTFNLTKVNELPAIDLGKDQTPCDGTTVTLDAGAGYEYLWSNGSTEQTIDLTANTETVWARIIDANKCINYDTVVVAFTYPYPEQIGVATFSETTDHIILAWEKTDGVNTVKYRIERETNVTDNWEQVGDDVMFAEAGLVVDEDVNYKQRAYKYRLVTTDGCGNEAVSEVHRSMISTTTRNDDGTKTLQWCAYEPMSNVTQYLVLRGYDATRMDTVDQVPASNLFEIWNETDSKFVNDKDIKYRVVFRLKSEVNENAVNKLDGQPVEGYYTKAESGPFSLALSNIAEAENDLDVDDVPFADVIVYPTTFNSYINVAIAASIETNFKVEILNANGQVMARTQTGDINKTLLQIPTDNFKQGVYTVKISDGQQTKTIKVVK